MHEARVHFTKLVYQRVRRIIETDPLDDTWEFDTWAARTNGKGYAYVKQLAEIRWRVLVGSAKRPSASSNHFFVQSSSISASATCVSGNLIDESEIPAQNWGTLFHTKW